MDIVGVDKSIPKSILKEVKERCSTPTTAITTYSKGRKLRNVINARMHTNHYRPYNYGYKSSDQLELDDWNDSFIADPDHQETIETDTYNMIYEAIDDYNSEYVKGTMNYDSWLNKVRELNKQLEASKSMYKLEVLTKKELDSRVIYSNPHEYISDPYDSYRYLGGHV